jgi:hypothetical protein
MFLTKLCQLQRLHSVGAREEDIVFGDFQGTGKEMFVAHLEVSLPLWNFAGGTEESDEAFICES